MIMLPPTEALFAVGALVLFLMLLWSSVHYDRKEQRKKDEAERIWLDGRAARLDAKYGCAPEPSITFRSGLPGDIHYYSGLPRDAQFQVAGTGTYFQQENFYTNQDMTVTEPEPIELRCVSCGAPKQQRICAYCGS